MEGISQRPATSDDLTQVLAIEKKVHLAPWAQSHFEAEIEQPERFFWVLTDDETDEVIYGYLVFHLREKQAELLNLAVDPRWQKQGLAKQLLRKMINFVLAEGAVRVFLDVRKSNDPAIQLYQGHGFETIRIKSRHYSNGEDALEMELKGGPDSPQKTANA